MEWKRVFFKWSSKVAWYSAIIATLVLLLRYILTTASILRAYIQPYHFWLGEIAIGSFVYLFVIHFVFECAFFDLFDGFYYRWIRFKQLVGILAFLVIIFTSTMLMLPHNIAEFLGISGLSLSYRTWMGYIIIISGLYLILLPFLPSNELVLQNDVLLFIFCTLSAISFFYVARNAVLQWVSVAGVVLFFVSAVWLHRTFAKPREEFYKEVDRRETEFFNSFPPTTMDLPLLYYERHGSPSKRELPTLRIIWIIQVLILVISLAIRLYTY